MFIIIICSIVSFDQSFHLFLTQRSCGRIKASDILIPVRSVSYLHVFAVQGHGDAVGGTEENQRVVLVLGGHVSLHQHQPAVAARRAQRRRLLRLPGRASVQRTEGSELHQPDERQLV